MLRRFSPLRRLPSCVRWLASTLAEPPPGLLKLRPYQKRAIDAARETLAAQTGNPLVVLPPGTGKSLLVAELIRSAREANPGARVVVLTASKELVLQNVDETRRLCEDQPGATSDGILDNLSIYNAALNRKEAKGMVIFGTIQSMYNKFEESWCRRRRRICSSSTRRTSSRAGVTPCLAVSSPSVPPRMRTCKSSG